MRRIADNQEWLVILIHQITPVRAWLQRVRGRIRSGHRRKSAEEQQSREAFKESGHVLYLTLILLTAECLADGGVVVPHHLTRGVLRLWQSVHDGMNQRANVRFLRSARSGHI